MTRLARVGAIFALLAGSLVTAASAAPPAGAAASWGNAGELTSVTPARILDTRDGTGRNGVIAPVGPAQTITVDVTGVGGVPATGVAAVVMNVTVVGPTVPSYLTVYPSGGTRPTVSNLNFVVGQTVPNLVTVRVGPDGNVEAFNLTGTVDVIFDVTGYYAASDGPAGSRYHGMAPVRFLDTRDGTGGPGGALQSGTTRPLAVTGIHGVPSTGVTAVALNVTVTAPGGPGFVTVFPDDVVRPLASNLNFVPGQTVPNLVVVRVPASGVIDFYAFVGFNRSVQVIADVVGWYDGVKTTEAGRFVPLDPFRVFDSRTDSDAPLGADEFSFIKMSGAGGVPDTGAAAVVMNVTATQPTAPSYITIFPDDFPDIPNASNLNFVAGQTVPNLVMVALSTSSTAWGGVPGTVDIYNLAGEVHVILDVAGWFTDATATPPA